MTRIARIEIQRIEGAPLDRPLHLAWDPGVVKVTDSFTVVRVFDDEGRMGVGSGGLGRPLRAASADLVGADLSDAAAMAERVAAVVARAGGVFGLDVALADLDGQLRGQPLAELWRRNRAQSSAGTAPIRRPGVEPGSGPMRPPWSWAHRRSGPTMRLGSPKRGSTVSNSGSTTAPLRRTWRWRAPCGPRWVIGWC